MVRNALVYPVFSVFSIFCNVVRPGSDVPQLLLNILAHHIFCHLFKKAVDHD